MNSINNLGNMNSLNNFGNMGVIDPLYRHAGNSFTNALFPQSMQQHGGGSMNLSRRSSRQQMS